MLRFLLASLRTKLICNNSAETFGADSDDVSIWELNFVLLDVLARSVVCSAGFLAHENGLGQQTLPELFDCPSHTEFD